LLSCCRAVAGVVTGIDVGFVHDGNVSSCLQPTLSSSAVACGGHRSVRVSHYTARSVTLAQGSCPICRLKTWLGQFLPVVVSCQREASLSVMVMGHGRVNMRFDEKQVRCLPTLKPTLTTLDPFGLTLEGPLSSSDARHSLGATSPREYTSSLFSCHFSPSRTHAAIIRKVHSLHFPVQRGRKKDKGKPYPPTRPIGSADNKGK
jgi:hypothetical protein